MTHRSTAMLLNYITRLFTLQAIIYSITSDAIRVHPSGERGKRGAVVTESGICSQVGIDLLERGGNAADAAVGTMACIGVVAPYHSGLGGGGFALVRTPKGRYESIDFREAAPAAASEDMFQNRKDASKYGGLASAVPGELRGLHYMHQKYGWLSWKLVLEPAVNISRDGWTVNDDLVRYMKEGIRRADGTDRKNFLIDDPDFAQDFAPKGQLLKAGETITRKRYSETLKAIGQHGPDIFYKGAMAKAMVRAVKARGGIMELHDLATYQAVIRKPVTINYRNFKLTACGAPAGGGVTLAAMKILEGYTNLGLPKTINSTIRYLDESMKFAYGMRAKLGDPSFVKGLDKFEKSMLSLSTAKKARAKIVAEKTFDVSHYDPERLVAPQTAGTSHIVVADNQGLSFSITTTVNLYFGALLVVPETGVLMNDQMDDFSTPGLTNFFGFAPAPANFIHAGKRPLSSVSPVIVEHLKDKPAGNALYLSLSAAGGSHIITATIQNLVYILDGKMTTAQAFAQPRMHEQLLPAQVTFEYAFDNRTAAYMKGLGANVTWMPPTMSSAQGLRRLPNGNFEAVGEPRQKNSKGIVL